MFTKSILLSAIVLGFVNQAFGHAAIQPQLGIQGNSTRSDVQQPSSSQPCGNTDIASNINNSTAVALDSTNSFSTSIVNFNGGQDGSTQVTAQVDPTGTGKSFVSATVTQNGQLAPPAAGSAELSVSLPSGTTCTGGTSGNLCLVSFTTAGNFGNCIVVSQTNSAAATGGSAASASVASNSTASVAASSSVAVASSSVAVASSSVAAASVAASSAAATDSTASTAAAAVASASNSTTTTTGKKHHGHKGAAAGAAGTNATDAAGGKKHGHKHDGAANSTAAATGAAAAADTTAAAATGAAAAADTTAAAATAAAVASSAAASAAKRMVGSRAPRALLERVAIEGADVVGNSKRGLLGWIFA